MEMKCPMLLLFFLLAGALSAPRQGQEQPSVWGGPSGRKGPWLGPIRTKVEPAEADEDQYLEEEYDEYDVDRLGHGTSGLDEPEVDRKDLGSGIEPVPNQREGQDGEDTSLWYQELVKRWNTLEARATQNARKVGQKIHSTYNSITGDTLPQVWGRIQDQVWGLTQEAFSKLGSQLGLMVRRGLDYTVRKIHYCFEEGAAGRVLAKLKAHLGDEAVDEFFQKVGDKLSAWAEQQRGPNLDDGLLRSEDHLTFSKHYGDPEFPDLFQDPEIRSQLDRMVEGGVLSQEEVDTLCQTGKEKPGPELDADYSEMKPFGIQSIPEPRKQRRRSVEPYSNGHTEPHHSVKKELVAMPGEEGAAPPNGPVPVSYFSY